MIEERQAVVHCMGVNGGTDGTELEVFRIWQIIKDAAARLAAAKRAVRAVPARTRGKHKAFWSS